jgi:hypothetical protein
MSGIGLIKVSRESVQIAVEARPANEALFQTFAKAVLKGIPSSATVRGRTVENLPGTFSDADAILSSMFRVSPSISASAGIANTMSKYIRTIATSRYKPRVSRELLDKVEDLHSVGYADLLREFRKEYDKAQDPIDENDTVLRVLGKLWAGKYGKTSGAKAFDSFEKFEPILKAIPGYRDHLIHPFQVFLMGTLIIDAHYQEFLRIYKRGIPNAQNDSLEFAWLLCSTFHDICYPIQMYDAFNKSFFQDFLQSEASPVVFQTEKLLIDDNHLKYMDQLVVLYFHLECNDNEDGSWEFDSPCKINASLRSAMIEELRNRNHALLSSLALLKKILTEEFVQRSRKSYLRGRFSTDIYPAALAIAMHDERMLLRLKKPTTLEKMPLSFLLVYCDLVQEYGRSEREENTKLHDFECHSNLIQSTLVFGYKYDFNKKTREMEKIFKKIASEDLCFALDLRCKGSTRTENSCKTRDYGE